MGATLIYGDFNDRLSKKRTHNARKICACAYRRERSRVPVDAHALVFSLVLLIMFNQLNYFKIG